MRSLVDPSKVERLLEFLGRRCRGAGRIYLAGGASALLHGWRDSTIDVDLKLAPEPAGVFEAIQEAKRELDINIELASPDHFLPTPNDWSAKSPFIARHGSVDFHHFDFRMQALAKLARAHDRDLADVRAMMGIGLVDGRELLRVLGEIQPALIRHPALDGEAFVQRVRTFVDSLDV